MIEMILKDLYKSDNNWSIAILRYFNNDYNTIDGTGVRDYIHVVDLAKEKLNWQAEKDIDDMCVDAYNFTIKKN